MNYNNPYYNPYNNQYQIQRLQNMRDEIDRQMQTIQQPVQQPVQPITQNFSLAPNPSNSDLEAKYVDTVEEVKNTFVMKTGIFTNKDFSKIWIKDVTGKIRTFTTQEEIEIDERDRELQEKNNKIYSLEAQVKELKEMMANATQLYNTSDDEQSQIEKSANISKSTKYTSKQK